LASLLDQFIDRSKSFLAFLIRIWYFTLIQPMSKKHSFSSCFWGNFSDLLYMSFFHYED